MLYTKNESSGPCSFGQEDFWKLHFENLKRCVSKNVDERQTTADKAQAQKLSLSTLSWKQRWMYGIVGKGAICVACVSVTVVTLVTFH